MGLVLQVSMDLEQKFLYITPLLLCYERRLVAVRVGNVVF